MDKSNKQERHKKEKGKDGTMDIEFELDELD